MGKISIVDYPNARHYTEDRTVTLTESERVVAAQMGISEDIVLASKKTMQEAREQAARELSEDNTVEAIGRQLGVTAEMRRAVKGAK